MRILVTGGAGFIGSAVCRQLASNPAHLVHNLDKLTYAGNLNSLRDLDEAPNYRFHHLDIADEAGILEVLQEGQIEAVMHLAAESHVDRSIQGPAAFIETNIIGTFHLLNATLVYWQKLDARAKQGFRFHHVSTDEVFGDLPFDGSLFDEDTTYAPSSPYAASKASADHLVRAWHATYGLPVVLSNCSNNYGPYHHPEKLIPRLILNALRERPLLIYGDGSNVRDWLHVEDHARALELIVTRGKVGQSYNVGGRAERTNLSVAQTICDLLDIRHSRQGGRRYRELIEFVADRPGHDRRYGVDPSKIERELGWRPQEGFETGIADTVDWYIDNEWWWHPMTTDPLD